MISCPAASSNISSAETPYEVDETVRAPDGTFWIVVDFGLIPNWATDPSVDTSGLWRPFLAADPRKPTIINGSSDYELIQCPAESIVSTFTDNNKSIANVWENGIDDVDSGRRWNSIESLEDYDCDTFDEASGNYLVFFDNMKVSIDDYEIVRHI